MRHWVVVVVVGVAVWVATGVALAALLALGLGAWTDAFAVSGIVLVVGAVGWTMGPFKSPMVWSEGALATYQGNADQLSMAAIRRRRQLIAVPLFALIAGILLLGLAALLATR